MMSDPKNCFVARLCKPSEVNSCGDSKALTVPSFAGENANSQRNADPGTQLIIAFVILICAEAPAHWRQNIFHRKTQSFCFQPGKLSPARLVLPSNAASFAAEFSAS